MKHTFILSGDLVNVIVQRWRRITSNRFVVSVRRVDRTTFMRPVLQHVRSKWWIDVDRLTDRRLAGDFRWSMSVMDIEIIPHRVGNFRVGRPRTRRLLHKSSTVLQSKATQWRHHGRRVLRDRKSSAICAVTGSTRYITRVSRRCRAARLGGVGRVCAVLGDRPVVEIVDGAVRYAAAVDRHLLAPDIRWTF